MRSVYFSLRCLEVPGSGLEVGGTHHIVTVLELSAGLEAALLDLLALLHHVELVDVGLGGHDA